MIKFISKNRNKIINTFLICLAIIILFNALIIVLNLTYLNTNQLELIVTTITGITTIIIISWALNESKKANKIIMHQNTIMIQQNKILMGQPIYDDFVKEISKFKDTGKVSVFSEPSLMTLNRISSFDGEGINYLNFFYSVDNLLMSIVDNECYQKYFPLVVGNKFVNVDIEDIKEVNKLISIMRILDYGYGRLLYWQNQTSYLFNSIIESEFLLKQQKTQLILTLENNCGDFLSYFKQAEEYLTEPEFNEPNNYYKAIQFKRILAANHFKIAGKDELLARSIKIYKKTITEKEKLSYITE